MEDGEGDGRAGKSEWTRETGIRGKGDGVMK